MLKFKRVKPKFSEANNNLANKPPIIRARLIQDNYFRSLYRYDPHATETTDDKDSKNKPRRVINYHKSLENLSDEFWKSVERAASPLGRGTISPSRNEDSPPSSTRSSTDDVTSSQNRLAVPGQTRPRAATETKLSEYVHGSQKINSLRAEALRKLEIAEGRPRSQSEFIISKRYNPERRNSEKNDAFYERSNYTLPRNFHMFESTERSRPASDRSSDISQPFSDSCSESSGDSDHLSIGNPHSPPYRGIAKRWSHEEEQNERLRIAEERLFNGLMRSEEPAQRKKVTKNPLENVIHWVIEPPKQAQIYRNHVEETHSDNAHHRRPDPPKRGESSKWGSLQRVHQNSGKPARLPRPSSSTAL